MCSYVAMYVYVCIYIFFMMTITSEHTSQHQDSCMIVSCKAHVCAPFKTLQMLWLSCHKSYINILKMEETGVTVPAPGIASFMVLV